MYMSNSVCTWTHSPTGQYVVLMILCLSSLPFITATADGPKHIDTTLTRVKFEELCSDLLDRYLLLLDKLVHFYAYTLCDGRVGLVLVSLSISLNSYMFFLSLLGYFYSIWVIMLIRLIFAICI